MILQSLHSFARTASNGYYPYGGLVVDKTNGYLYGTTYYGGVIWNAGAVYQLREVSGVWIFSVIYNFLGDSLGQYPYAIWPRIQPATSMARPNTGGSFNLG